ncbi:hypothetical protein JHK82_032332 [Glycine max]|nr:hypothetical protein JHK86_032428 [Glycine max]KAG5125595.1 hypothetical protein JHK82_032332 [Glycine max]KAG5147027.1 hypothetical protein JHK84_032570 [Glycine max]
MMRGRTRHEEDEQSRALYQLSALVLNLLRSPLSSLTFSDEVPPLAASRRPGLGQISPAGFASLLLGISLALMLCGSVTFFIGFVLMPWVLGLVMLFYVAGILSSLSVFGRSILCYATAPPSPRKDIPVIEREGKYDLTPEKQGLYRIKKNVLKSDGLEYSIDDLFQEAKRRWLKPVEALYILRNHDQCKFTHQPPHQPAGNITSCVFFVQMKDRIMRSFRKDGHNWRKKKDGKTVGEAHERLKVGNVEILNCYYAHGEENRTFQRRSYWMLEPEYDHIVLVHYRETSEGKSNSEHVTQLPSGSSPAFSQSHSSYTAHNPGTASMIGDSCEPNQNFSFPGSLEVTFEAQALRQLEEQLSLNDDGFNEIALDLVSGQDQRVVYKQDKSAALSGPNDLGQPCDGYNGRQGNRVPCSEMREFEFRNKTTSCTRCNSLETEGSKSPEDLLLLVRFAEMLLSSSTTKDDRIESGSHLSTEQKDDDDSWSHIIDTLLDSTRTPSDAVKWLLEELLKDKLQLWLSNRRDEGTGCSLSKKEQGIIHMVSGLGFEWALNPILSCGVNINFRDINGWTALHWAARFGRSLNILFHDREKMVASLIASGASAGAVTDPSSQDPTGKTAASIAASHDHKGLAGYLSEVDLTSHLSSLTLEESELSRESSELEAELTVSSVSEENLVASEDQVSLKASLDAVRNAAQAAARIQAAFRAHSFRKRKERDAAATVLDGYCIDAGSIDNNISVLSAMSKLSSQSWRDYKAALSIQKKYRNWKGRIEFLALRQKIVKIQVVLRWRRKRIGIQSVRQEMESNEEESDDADFLNVFRKEKLNAAIEKALKRVLSMVHSTGARQQYRRLLSLYRQAKIEHGSTSDEAPLSTSEENASNMEDDDLCQFLDTFFWPS